MDPWVDLVLIQRIRAAGCGADSAVGGIDCDHGGTASFYINIMRGIGKSC